MKTIEIRTFNRWPSGKDGGHETVARCAHKLVPLVELGPGSCFGERGILYGELRKATVGAGQESEIPNFKASYLGRFPLVSADFWTSDHLSERSRSVDAVDGTRARGTLTLKRR